MRNGSGSGSMLNSQCTLVIVIIHMKICVFLYICPHVLICLFIIINHLCLFD